jgi:hypothetical protein
MLANIWLRRNGHPITAWPDRAIGDVSEIREAYISAIKAADEGDYAALIVMHERFSAGG